MTTTRELLEQALEALVDLTDGSIYQNHQNTITAIREHLARPEPEKNYIEKAIDAVVERIHNDKDQL